MSPTCTAQIARICLPKDYVRLKLTGEHASDVSDASGTLLFDVAARNVERRNPGRARDTRRVASAGLSSRRRSRVGRRPGSRWRPARVTRQRARSESASSGPGPLSVVLGTSGVVSSRPFDDYVCDPQARLHVFCHAVPDTWHAMGVMLSAAGSLQLAPGRAWRFVREAAGRSRGMAPGCEGLSFASLSVRRAHTACGPRRQGCFLRPRSAPRPRRALPVGARRGGLWTARLAGAPALAGSSSLGWHGSPGEAPTASCGSRSSPRFFGCRSS